VVYLYCLSELAFELRYTQATPPVDQNLNLAKRVFKLDGLAKASLNVLSFHTFLFVGIGACATMYFVNNRCGMHKPS